MLCICKTMKYFNNNNHALMLIIFNQEKGINKNIVGLLTQCNQNKFFSTIYRIYTFRL